MCINTSNGRERNTQIFQKYNNLRGMKSAMINSSVYNAHTNINEPVKHAIEEIKSEKCMKNEILAVYYSQAKSSSEKEEAYHLKRNNYEEM